MAYLGLALLAFTATVVGVVWWRKWLRAVRALTEWAFRWEQAAELCALPGCLQGREAPCHLNDEYLATERERWGFHRFVPARLVAAPNPLLREGIGVDR